MRNRKLKFVIASPPQWCGGAIALYALCKGLCDSGYNAKIWYCTWDMFKQSGYGVERGTRKRLLTHNIRWLIKCFLIIIGKIFGLERFKRLEEGPVKGCKYYLRQRVGKNTIVVYPESLYADPILKAKKAVHWILYYYNPEEWAYNKDDLFIAYRKQFNNKELNPNEYTATVSYFDLDLYRQYYFGEREGKCYVIRKGRDRDDLPNEFDGPVIDNLSEEEKVACFNKYKYCVSYDMQTAYSGIAAMCGCISVVIPEPGKSKSDYRTAEDNTDGIAYGFGEDEIAHAIATRDNVLKRYEATNESGKQNAKRFAEICVKHFFAEKTDGNKIINR